MRSSEIGGQAVIEGVMMKNKNKYAVAVRKPDKEIAVEVKNTGNTERKKFFKLPIVRGVVAFIDSMVVGIKTLSFSASFFEDEEEVKKEEEKKAKKNNKTTKSNKNKKAKTPKTPEEQKRSEELQNKAMIAGTITLSVALSVGFFMLLPLFLSSILVKVIDSENLLTLAEAVIRITLFVGYILVISQVEDIKRVFRYHGAEHKTINCIENGFELTVENARKQSRLHKRCGTSFMFLVIFISLIFFAFIKVEAIWLQALIRVLLVPVIAGIAFEFIRFAGKSDSKFVRIVSQPGFWLQGLTTKEPDDSMLEVAIASVEAVFDWRKFLADGQTTTSETEKEMPDDSITETGFEIENETINETINETDNVTENETDKTAETETVIAAEIKTESITDSIAAPVMEQAIIQEVLIETPKTQIEDESKDDLKSLDKPLAFKKPGQSEKKIEPVVHTKKNESTVVSEPEEEDEILRALDKFFVFEKKDANE